MKRYKGIYLWLEDSNTNPNFCKKDRVGLKNKIKGRIRVINLIVYYSFMIFSITFSLSFTKISNT